MKKCKKCGEQFHDSAVMCPNCGMGASDASMASFTVKKSISAIPLTPKVTADTYTEINIGLNYATFGQRAIASIIDCALYCVISIPAVILFGDSAGFISFFIGIGIYGYFDSSEFMGTPGKIITHLKVVDLNGNRITFSKAVIRYVCKLLSGLIVGIGYLLPLFTEKKQTLHDIISGCVVIKQ